MQPVMEQVSLTDEFTDSAIKAVATVEVIDRSPAILRDAILRAVGDAQRILYAPPQDLPVALFSEFAKDPRVVAEPTADELVHSAAGVTEAFAGVARTGSVCVDVSYERTAMVSLLAPLQIAVVAAETIVPQPRDLFRDGRARRQRHDARFRLRHRPQRHRRHGPAGARRPRTAQAAHHRVEVSMATSVNPADITPRSVANKSDKKALLEALRMTLSVQSAAIRHNTQTFNRNRYAAVGLLEDYNELKDRARQIKENAIANLPQLLRQLEASVVANGGHFYLAKTAADADTYVRDVLLRHQVKLVVKGKSITSEEIKLNHTLEAAGIEVAETDLAEFILQVADEQPSHIVAPALHYSRERITALFKRKFHTDLPLDTGEELTKFAREILREKFIAADAGISGANFVAADSGSLMLVESEGNIRMTMTLPPVHIAIAGIEKVVPSRTDFATFIELLPRSGTGQPLTSYVSILHPPLKAPTFAAPGKEPAKAARVPHGADRQRAQPHARGSGAA